MTLSVHVEGGICFPGSCPSSPGLRARPAICSGAGPPPPTVTFSRNNRLPAGCSRRRSVRKRTCQPLPQPAWRLVCVNSPAGLSAAAPPGSVRARKGGDAWLPWAPAEGLAAGAPGQTLSPASVLCYCSRWGFRRSDQVTAQLAPPLRGAPPLLRTGPPSSWPRVGRAPHRMAVLLAARVSSARLPVCSLQSRPVGRTLFPVPLLTRILWGLSPPWTAGSARAGRGWVSLSRPSRQHFWMLPAEGRPCPRPGSVQRPCPGVDPGDADSAALSRPHLCSASSASQLRWCLLTGPLGCCSQSRNGVS